MDMRDKKSKPKAGSVRRNKPEASAEALTEKELLQVYNLLRAFEKLLEEAERTPGKLRVKGYVMTARAGEAKPSRVPKHLGRAIAQAETWPERDLVCRRASSVCYERANAFYNRGDYKNAYKWMSLAHKYYKLAMDPKKQITEEELQHIEDMLEEIKGKQKEDEEAAFSHG
jgi:hypothetical protein